MQRIKNPVASEGSKESLIKAAKTLFAQKGFDGTSVKELAKAAGVNISLVSYHFGGKEGLYRSCLDQFGKARLAMAQRVLQPAQSADEFRVRLQMFTGEMIGCHLEEPEVGKIIHRECELQLPMSQDIFRETFLRVFETLINFIKSAQKNGILRKDLDSLIISTLFFGSLIHMTRSDYIGQKYFGVSLKDAPHREKVTEHLLRTFLEGLQRKDRGTQ